MPRCINATTGNDYARAQTYLPRCALTLATLIINFRAHVAIGILKQSSSEVMLSRDPSPLLSNNPQLEFLPSLH